MDCDAPTRSADRLRRWARFLAAGEMLYAGVFAAVSHLVLEATGWAPSGKLWSLALLGALGAGWLVGYVALLGPGEHRMRRLRLGSSGKAGPADSAAASLVSALVCLSLPLGILVVATLTGPEVFGWVWIWIVLGAAAGMSVAAVALGPRRRRTQPVDRDPAIREFQDFAASQGHLGVWFEWMPGPGLAGCTPAGYVAASAARPARIFLDRNLVEGLSEAGRRALFAHELAHHACGHPLESRLGSRAVTLTGALLVAWLAWYRLEAWGPGAMPGLLGPTVCFLMVWERAWGLGLLAWSRRQERQAHRRALRMTGDPQGYREAMSRLEERGFWPGRVAASLLDSHPAYPEVLELIEDFGRNVAGEPMTPSDGSR